MKYSGSLIVVALIFALSCKKSPLGSNEQDQVLEGTWELRQSYSGMTPLKNYPAGNGDMISFKENSYKIYRNHQVVYEGLYSLSSDTTIDVNSCAKIPPNGEEPNTINYNNNPSQSFVINGSTLKITFGCIPADGGWSLYKKIKTLK